ncbi:P2Y purinoceptor 1 [Colossoma macropomum]|uniref:P2Y purinoceptor 1 n=1 Tax=Colossoma macropomum TaxID=42526 RepID=UPI001863DBAD|nr:P2Y purinoceptor 1 [Colossoma macropomum]
MGTNLTCEQVDFNFTHIFLSTVYVFVFVFGLLGNCFGLKSVHANWTKLGNVNIFALNLCIADILYLLTLPLLVAYYANGQEWIFGQSLCKLTRFLFSINLYGSIGFLTVISVYRYLSIVHPLKVKGRIRAHCSMGITALVWILVFVQSLPEVYFEKTSQNMSQCYDTTVTNSTEKYLRYSIVRTVTGFAIPLVVMVCCYGHVAFTLATNKDFGDNLLKLRCLRLVVVLALLFSVCFIPYHIFRNLNLQTRIWKTRNVCQRWFADVYIANQIGNGLACLNIVINPLVYLFNGDELLMRCFKCVRLQTLADSAKFSPASLTRKVRETVIPPSSP